MRLADHHGCRHPPGKGDRGVARRKAASQGGAPPGVRLCCDDHDDRHHQCDQRQLGRRIPQLLEQARAPVGHLPGEHEVADRDRVDRRDQDCPCRDILGELRKRVERGGGDVDRLLQRRVDHLGDEDEGDREQKRDQLELRDADRESRPQHDHRRQEMDPHVPLRAEDVDDPFERKVDAFEQGLGPAVRHPLHRASSFSISAPWS